jgi:hypothetical protein
MKKLEKDQLPKVIALGVLATGLLGYAGYTWLGSGGGGATPAVAAVPAPAEPVAGTPAKPEETNPALQLAAIHHEDPFRPIFAELLPAPAKPAAPPAPAKPAAAPAPPKPEVKPTPPPPTMVDIFEGPAMEALPGVRAATRLEQAAAGRPDPTALQGPAPKPAPAPAPKPAAAPPPPPPAVVVTGILEGDDNVAILKWNDSHRQVVRVGDRLDGGYVVKAIRTDAVVVTRGSHQWTVRLGSDQPAGN